MRYVFLLIPLIALLAFACDDNGDGTTPTATLEPEVLATAEPTDTSEARLLFLGFTSSDELGLYSVGDDGTGLTLVASLDGDRGTVSSPDGKQFAIACPRDEDQPAFNTDICVGAAGGPETRIEIGEELTGIVWAPDSRRLAFTTVLQGDDVGVFLGTGVAVVDADGSDLQHLIPATKGIMFERLQWSPDGQQLAFLALRLKPDNPVQRTDLEVVTLRDGVRTNLTEQIVEAGEVQMGIEEFSWAPDGSALAFQRNSLGSGGNVELYSVTPDGSDLRQLTDTPDWHETGAVWSPDGRSLAVSATPAGRGPVQVFIVPAAGGEAQPLAPDLSQSDYPVWSPDGRRLAFVSADGAPGTCPALQSVYVTNVENGDPQAVASGGLLISSFITWSPSGRYLFYVPVPEGAGELDPSHEGCGSLFLFSVPVDGSASPAQVTDFAVLSFVGWQPQP